MLFIVGVKGWLFFGMLTGFGAMIPYVGFTIGLISSVIAAIYTFHDFIHPLYTVIGFVIVQVLESMVITPKIVGDSLGISPVVVIVGLMIGGALAGFLGMIIALPIAAFIKILIDTYVFKKPMPQMQNKTDKKELSNSFYNECQDQKFKDFALSLELSEDILMNYTSRLKEAFLECNNCKNCKDLSYCKNAVEGFKLTPIKEKNIINFSYLICEKLEENLLQEAFKHNLELFEMPKAIKEASLKNIYNDDKARLPIIKYFKEFIENYGKESSF